MDIPSWRFKLQRAEKHLGEFKTRIAPLQVRQSYPVSEGFETYNGQLAYVRRLDIPPIDDAEIAVVAGDILFNCRSSLDHLAMALVPETRRTARIVRATQFPIFTCDIDDTDPVTGRYLHRGERKRWDRMVQGIASEAILQLKWFQPYNFLAQGRDPTDSSFAILGSLQNADKHRQLNLVTRGISDPTSRFIHPNGLVTGMTGQLEDKFLGDGTVVDYALTNDLPGVTMEVEGSPQIFVSESRSGPFRKAPGVFESIIKGVGDCFTKLEPLMPSNQVSLLRE